MGGGGGGAAEGCGRECGAGDGVSLAAAGGLLVRMASGSTRASGGALRGRSAVAVRLPNIDYACLRPVRSERKGNTLLSASAAGVRPVITWASRRMASAVCDFGCTSISIWPLFAAAP